MTSKIDYKWVSKGLLHRIGSCELVDETRLWGKKATPSYHKALLTTVTWPGIWDKSAGSEPKGATVQGAPIPLGPDMARLDQDKEKRIAQTAEQMWTRSWDTIRGTYRGKLPYKKKAEILNDHLTRVLTEAANKVLGKKKSGGKAGDTGERLLAWWDEAHMEVGKYLGKTHLLGRAAEAAPMIDNRKLAPDRFWGLVKTLEEN